MPSDVSNRPSREPIDRLREAPVTPMAVRAALGLGVFTALGQTGMTADELAHALSVKPRRLELLLLQLVVGEFLELHDGRFSNTEMAAHYLVEGAPDYIGAVYGNWTGYWRSQLVSEQSIRTDVPQAKVDFEGMSTEELSGFLKGLHGAAVIAGRNLAKHASFAKAKRVVDIGGGSGGVAIGLCQIHPELSVTVVDMPAVVPIGKEMVEEAGLADRISVVAADLTKEPLSDDFDIATARAFFQVLSADDCEKAARYIAAAIRTGGELFVIGFILDDRGLSPEVCVAQNVCNLNIFDNGEAYREALYRSWLTDAGFVDITRSPEAQGRSLITVRKA
jgi:SAM-dependent methyltransferase